MPGVAVIGTGHWGKNHARIYKELWVEGMVDMVKICDINETHLHEISTTLNLKGVADYRQILDDPEIQAVSIATPSKTHYQIAKEFMETGKDVLVEKPMTMNVKEAEELVNIAARTKRILMVGHVFRYHPAVQELKCRIDAGELGAIQNIISYRLSFGLPRQDMGVIYALGIHELDMFCYLLEVDYPKKLIAMANTIYGQDIEETAMITMDFGNAKGYALESWLVPAFGKKRELIVAGTDKSAKIDYLDPEKLRLFDAKLITKNSMPILVENKGEYTISIPYAEPLKEELKHFIFCVRSRQKPLSDGLVGLRAVAMAEAALTSAKTSTVIKFKS